MEYRTFGRTGLNVSRIGFGGAPVGLPGYLTREDRDSAEFVEGAVSAVREAVARGINYFDTAPTYGDGRAERIMGMGLEGSRDRVVIATKYWFDPSLGFDVYTRNLGESLERLKTDHVDILQFHGLTFDDELAGKVLESGVLDWVDEMKARGLCRFRGITAEAPSGALEKLILTGRFDALLIAYNLIYQGACDYQRKPFGIIPMARSLGMGVAAMRPTTSGFLQKLCRVALPKVSSAEITELAVNFVLSTSEVDCAVIGMRNASEVAENAALAENPGKRLDIAELHNRFN